MRPATPAVMGRNLAVPCGNRRRSQGNDSNEQHPRVVEAQLGERGDLSAAKCSAFQGLLR